ncbi:hypothetical protein FHR84_002583 [Actinopolyspora biskrensis]|uniref:Uncharacterized protein n=1 Tax=Actinopolyspora biskrensis TaxID=1470178 RepID=A0A852Z0D0_9ACTN|nr:hypothetical protein [Actinopolyspora biskrensis]
MLSLTGTKVAARELNRRYSNAKTRLKISNPAGNPSGRAQTWELITTKIDPHFTPTFAQP